MVLKTRPRFLVLNMVVTVAKSKQIKNVYHRLDNV